MKLQQFEVPLDKLRWKCDTDVFAFDHTKDLAPLKEFVGQDRAIKAIEFGLVMNRDGYNIYVAGLTGTGKTSAVNSYIKRLIEEKQEKGVSYELEDWCYLYNFADSDRPRIYRLKQGQGKILKTQMTSLLESLKEELAKAFTGDDYKEQLHKAVEAGETEQREIFNKARDQAREQGFLLQLSPQGPVLIPLSEGKPMEQSEFMELEESARRDIENKRNDLLKALQSSFEKIQEIARETGERVRETDRSVADYTVSRLLNKPMKEYKDSEDIIAFFNELKTYILDNPGIFKEQEAQPQESQVMPIAGIPRRDPYLPFEVNVFVDNSAGSGPPVITEPNPTYPNLFGKVERRFLLGGYLSDHTMIKAGSLQQAHGGYLLLSAADVLTNPGVWPALKRALRTKEVRIEDPYEQMGFVVPQGLRPQAMPANVKVVLIGDGTLYQLLAAYDEEFWEIFKVKADFDSQIERTPDNMISFAAFIAGYCQDCEMRHFDRSGVGRILEYAARVVADQEKLSSRFAWIRELIDEAEYWAQHADAPFVTSEHVDKAIEERRFRHNLPDENLREMITEGTIMIDTEGGVVGQVNGLSIYQLGDVSFGKPSRITCQTFLGRRGVINIERESQLSGRIHDKGVLILGGYLGYKFAQDSPLSLSASLCFEQSYSGVDGDSASSTELYALLSSLSDLPIDQGIAVTGSVNQRGEIQPIGGVNQKIEGFFQICQEKGLTGRQGVMIPSKNLRNLMLRDEVIDAVRDGKFHIYAVDTVDQGIEVLTGVPAGTRRKNGRYQRGTVNQLVEKHLKEMATRLKGFSESEGGEKKEQTPTN
jgi:predicted ATP-dependent protease